jgi:hypothetical protein
MFAPLLGYLLRPKPHILNEVNEFVNQFHGKRLIGIQMRTTENYAREDYLPIYEECTDLVAYENDILFVSTDSVPARDMLIKKYGDRVVFYENEKIHMSRGHGRYRTTVLHGIKDILTLARCDEMIITCGSSFSRIAVGLARKPPTIVSGIYFQV